MKKIKISPETLKALYFMIGVIVAGLSINYYRVNPFLATVGVLVGVFFVIRAIE